MDRQLGFDFNGPGDSRGFDAWREARRAKLGELARSLGLPFGRRVRVEFSTGSPLEGILLMDEEDLFISSRRDNHLRLRIGQASFEAGEIISCTTLEP
jgi:hypothetical protein